MKLYTEEQVNLAMRLATFTDDTYNQVLEKLTPIEIPSALDSSLREIIQPSLLDKISMGFPTSCG